MLSEERPMSAWGVRLTSGGETCAPWLVAMSKQLSNLQGDGIVSRMRCIFGESTRSLTCNVGRVLEDGQGANEEKAGSDYMYGIC